MRNGHRPPLPVQSADDRSLPEAELRMTEMLLRIMQKSWSQHHSERTSFDEITEEMLPLYNNLRQPDWSLYSQPRAGGMRGSMNNNAMMYMEANASNSRLSMHNSAGNRSSMRMNSNSVSARNSTYFHAANRPGSMHSNAISHGPHNRALTFGGRSQAPSQGNHSQWNQSMNNDVRRSRHVTASSALNPPQSIVENDEHIFK